MIARLIRLWKVSEMNPAITTSNRSIPTSSMTRHRQIGKLLAVLLGLAVIALYWPVRTHGWITFDDDLYITNNSNVRHGLTADNLGWAFTTVACGNYHPLVWLAHMLAWDAFGDNPAGHHLLSVALHALSSGLLLVVLYRMTGALWRSAFVAAVFALHPLRVESVAWAAELKDTLSTFLLMTTLWAWARYVKNADHRYLPFTLLLYALGLLAKPMLVTLPILLGLLDVWPLARVTPARARRLVWEKAPFALLALIDAGLTFFAQSRGHAVASAEVVSIGGRITNALLACAYYVRDTFWPAWLAIGYPHAGMMGRSDPSGAVLGAAVLLVAVSGIVYILARRGRPEFAVGWSWYLVGLLPVVGLIQVGSAARADRYTYVPQIGLLIIVAWAIPPRWVQTTVARGVVSTAALAILVALVAETSAQIGYWKDDATLTAHAISLYPDDYIAMSIRGNSLLAANHPREAAEAYAMELKPLPKSASVYWLIASAQQQAGEPEQALESVRNALACDPSFIWQMPERHKAYAMVLAENKELTAALEQWQIVLRSDPADADVHFAMSRACTLLNRPADAAEQLETCRRLRPEWAEPISDLAWLRAHVTDPKIADYSQAASLAREAIGLVKKQSRSQEELNAAIAQPMDALALAQAHQGDFTDAVVTATAAMRAAEASNGKALAAAIQKRLEAYQQHKFPE